MTRQIPHPLHLSMSMQILLFLSLATTAMAPAGQAVRQKGAGQYWGHIDFSISPPFLFYLGKSGGFSGNPDLA
jgi:hypothetical protein